MKTTIDNISNATLDILKAKYQSRDDFRVSDERKDVSFGREKEYFLIEYRTRNKEFTFIWIGGNLWQYRYTNMRCKDLALWANPLDVLNNLLNQK